MQTFLLLGCTPNTAGTFRGQNLNKNLLLFKLFGRPWDVPAKDPGIILPNRLSSPGFEAHTEPFDTHPFIWNIPTPPEDMQTQKFEFVLISLA